MKNNIKSVRECRSKTQKECADTLGITLRAWQTYEQGVREPKQEVLCKIADMFNVSLDYLLGRETGEPETIDKLAGEFNMTALEKEILDNYLSLPKDMRGDLMEFLEKSVQKVMDEKRCIYIEEPEEESKIEINYSFIPASAGTGTFLDEQNIEMREFPDTPESRQADIVIPVDGDSMEPMFYDGDKLYVRLQPAVEIGEIGIFEIGDKGYVKKYAVDKLISLNPKYDDIYFDEYSETKCVGKVIGKVE